MAAKKPFLIPFDKKLLEELEQSGTILCWTTKTASGCQGITCKDWSSQSEATLRKPRECRTQYFLSAPISYLSIPFLPSSPIFYNHVQNVTFKS